jgi:methionyl-tRNA synthetase
MSKLRLVTSALPYANGDIHLGHMVEHIQTDIYVRFNRLMGRPCVYLCADDTHGTAVMMSAERHGIPPETYIDRVRHQHMADFSLFNISYDAYYSTHSPENQRISADIYRSARADGAIITRDIDQYFCEQSGLFLADRYIKGHCPSCNAPDQYGDTCEVCYATYAATDLKNPVSVFSGKAPVIRTSTHYFFTVSKYTSVIQQWLTTNPVVDAVKNKLQEWFDAGLNDWDISRDAPYFGFPIPDTINKYFYVWLDAPVGYIAATDYWATSQGLSYQDVWNNADIHHFIGKDIMYFHTLFWPAMLSVAGLQQPKRIHVHGFLTVNGEKMSKSRGTFILARDYAAHLDTDSLRYYYAAKLSPSLDDMDFSVSDFVNRVNADVLGKFVNIVSRMGAIITKKCEGRLSTIDADGDALLHRIRQESTAIQHDYDNTAFHRAMRRIMACAEWTNQYIDAKAPWGMAPDAAQTVATVALNAASIISIYLMPVMPRITAAIHTLLNTKPTQWSDCHHPLINHPIQPYTHILKRLTVDEVNRGLFSSNP